MAQSIRQRIIDQVVVLLAAAAPPLRKVRKGRKASNNEGYYVQVYWHIEQVRAIGNPRKPMLADRNLTLEIKITVPGDDEVFDAECQWVVAALWTAGNLGGLVKNVSEGETVPYLEDSSVTGALTAGAIRYAVEYTTLPGDLTAGN
jgi:hypothetical protein